MTSLLEQALKSKALTGLKDRDAALMSISRDLDRMQPYRFCALHGLLVEKSAEQFTQEFYPAFNNEIYYKY